MEYITQSGILTFIFIVSFILFGAIAGVFIWEKKVGKKLRDKIRDKIDL